METIKAGRELDQAVAERLFGASDFRKCSFGVYMSVPGEEDRCELPRYSTSIEAAFQVVEKLGGYALIERMTTGGLWLVSFAKSVLNKNPAEANAKTLPLAICLAALESVGYTEEVKHG